MRRRRLRVRVRQLWRWASTNLGWLILLGLVGWTGYSIGWVDAVRVLRGTGWEGERRVWIGRAGVYGPFVLRGDPASVADATEAIDGWRQTRCLWGAGRPAFARP